MNNSLYFTHGHGMMVFLILYLDSVPIHTWNDFCISELFLPKKKKNHLYRNVNVQNTNEHWRTIKSFAVDNICM